MAVPQNALPISRKFGRRGNTLRIRRNNPVDSRWYCGTVITVPYRMVDRRGDSRIARRPNGAEKSPPRGEGGPRQRVGRGMRAEAGKSVQPYRPTPGPVIVPWSRSSGFSSSNVTARIPLQSPVGSEEPTGDSFSPGEAFSRDPLGRAMTW